MRGFLPNYLANNRGKANSNAPTVIFIIVLVVGGFLGYKFYMPKWQNTKFKTKCQEILNWDKFSRYADPPTVKSMTDDIMAAAREYGIALDPKKVKVTRSPDKSFNAEITYTRTVTLPIINDHVYTFHFFLKGN